MFTKPKEPKNTISQEEYERRLKELQDEIEELKKIKVEESKEKGIWIPKEGEEYYYLDASGHIEKDRYVGCNFLWTDFKIIYGNYYKTEEDAFEQYCVQKYTNLFRKYVEEHSKPLDWTDIGTDKWFIKWSFYNGGDIVFDCYSKVKAQGTVYASSKEILEDAIEFIGRDNVIKYVLGGGKCLKNIKLY